MLRIVLEKPDLQVMDVHTQVFVENLVNFSVRLDILATDSSGTKYSIEIQRADKGAGRKRAIYNSSMLDANLLQKGEDFSELPETYVIFVTENDVLGKGLPLYPVERYILVTGERFEDGAHILYVNGAYRGDSPIGRLMHDFGCVDPSDMYYDVLAERVKFFKESKEGVAVMCRAIEDMWKRAVNEGFQEGLQEGRMESNRATARCMLLDGSLSLEKIAEFSGLSIEEVKKL